MEVNRPSRYRSASGGRCTQLEPNTFLALEILDDLDQVARLRISGGAQHPHQALGRAVGGLGQFVESHGSVDVTKEIKELLPWNITSHTCRSWEFPVEADSKDHSLVAIDQNAILHVPANGS